MLSKTNHLIRINDMFSDGEDLLGSMALFSGLKSKVLLAQSLWPGRRYLGVESLSCNRVESVKEESLMAKV